MYTTRILVRLHQPMYVKCLSWETLLYTLRAGEAFRGNEAVVHRFIPRQQGSWGLSAPDGSHVGPMNLPITVAISSWSCHNSNTPDDIVKLAFLLNSLAAGRCGSKVKCVIFMFMLCTKFMSTYETALMWIPQSNFKDNPYPEPLVFQWQSSGNPVCLKLRPQCTLECHWINASVLPVVFQWCSSGFPVVFQCVPIMLINTGSPLGHHWMLS